MMAFGGFISPKIEVEFCLVAISIPPFGDAVEQDSQQPAALGIPKSKALPRRHGTVSYTHLDVYKRQLEGGADIIVGGRAYDAAVIAAYPIWKGEDPGLSYHMGKIIECGTAVALPRESDGMLGVIDGDSFIVTPADPEKICKPDTVAAHTLYERSTPITLSLIHI